MRRNDSLLLIATGILSRRAAADNTEYVHDSVAHIGCWSQRCLAAGTMSTAGRISISRSAAARRGVDARVRGRSSAVVERAAGVSRRCDPGPGRMRTAVSAISRAVGRGPHEAEVG